MPGSIDSASRMILPSWSLYGKGCEMAMFGLSLAVSWTAFDLQPRRAVEAVTGNKCPWMQPPGAEMHPNVKQKFHIAID